MKVFEGVVELVEFHLAFEGAEYGFVAVVEPEFLFFKASEDDGHCFFVDGFHKLVRVGREDGEGISCLIALEIAAPQSGKRVRLAARDKYLDRRQAFAFDRPLVKAVDRKNATLAFLQKIGPELFVVHRLDACVERGKFRFELPRSVPLTPPTRRSEEHTSELQSRFGISY